MPMDRSKTTRCKHLNVLVSQRHDIDFEHHFREGVYSFSSPGDPHPTTDLEVYCRDCGYSKIYTKSTIPNWLIHLMADAEDAGR